jgi:hypothetical protein
LLDWHTEVQVVRSPVVHAWYMVMVLAQPDWQAEGMLAADSWRVKRLSERVMRVWTLLAAAGQCTVRA